MASHSSASELANASPRNYIWEPNTQMKTRSFAFKIVVTAVALMASSLWAQDGLKGALAQVSFTDPVTFGTPFSQTLAAADLDGDNKPDGAVLIDHDWLGPQNNFRTSLRMPVGLPVRDGRRSNTY